MKTAIIGLAPTSRPMAPIDDPEFECWGLAWDVDRHRFARTFEMHEYPLLLEFETKQYLEDLEQQVNLYTADGVIKGSKLYPFDEVAKTICGAYWCSSISYAMAMAVHEDRRDIHLFGIDMKGADEYAYQRANMEYLIGLARGRGITVTIPDVSPLCKYVDSPSFKYDGRYGKKIETQSESMR